MAGNNNRAINISGSQNIGSVITGDNNQGAVTTTFTQPQAVNPKVEPPSKPADPQSEPAEHTRHDHDNDTAVLMVAGAERREEVRNVFMRDVDAMKDLLISEHVGICGDKISTVYQKPKSKISTKESIKEAIVKVARELKGTVNGHFIFYYSGHFGYHTLKVDMNNEYKDEELVDDLLKIPAKYVLFIMDMCYSATANLRTKDDEQETVEEPRILELFTSKKGSFNAKAKGPGDGFEAEKVVQWASSISTSSYEDLSYFTKAIIDVITHPQERNTIQQNIPDDKHVTILQLNPHVDQLMKKRVQQSQTPMIKPLDANETYFRSFPYFAKIR